MHATDSIPQSSGQAAHDVMLAVVGSLAKSHVDPRSSIRGTAFGIVLGAVEARLDIVEVAQQALDAAAEAARQTGLSAETAETEAAAGIMEAAVAAGPEAVAKVKAILPNQ
jgi:hypothetical protein